MRGQNILDRPTTPDLRHESEKYHLSEQDRYITYKVKLRRVRATIVAEEKQ